MVYNSLSDWSIIPAFLNHSVLETSSVSLEISKVFMPCCLLTGGYQHFRGTYCLCLQDVSYFDPENEGRIFLWNVGTHLQRPWIHNNYASVSFRWRDRVKNPTPENHRFERLALAFEFMWIWIEIYKWRTCSPFCESLDDSAFSFYLIGPLALSCTND